MNSYLRRLRNELIPKLTIVLGEPMIEYEKKLCDLTGGIIQAVAKKISERVRICSCVFDLA